MPAWRRILLTGAAGEIGRVVRPVLRGAAGTLRLLDRRPMDPAADGEELMEGDLSDPDLVNAATRDVDLLIHLAGIPRETGGTPEEILATNVVGTHTLFEAARRNGARRIVFASSNHTIGFHRADRMIGTEEPTRPSGFYGASKVYGEALGRLYADKYDMDVVCLRIGAFRERPGNARELGGWISHGDMAHLARCCADAPPFGFLIVYGVSANRRALWGNDAAARARLGYAPRDDAEAFAAELENVPAPGGPVAAAFHGGSVAALGFVGEPGRVR
ncbi:NAD-dependent epimerase/dehydratase family protein [Roseomonas sp. GCM10028921]